MDIIAAYVIDYNLYSDCQLGFRKHRSCDTQLLHVVEDLSDMFDDGDPYDIIYIDLIYIDHRVVFWDPLYLQYT